MRDIDILDLPDAPDINHEPPKFTWEEMVIMVEKNLEFYNTLRYSKPEPVFIGEAFKLLD